MTSSPFAHAEATLPARKGAAPKVLLGSVLAGLLVAGGVVGGVLLARHLSDPFRTLEAFPVAKYLDGYRALAGARFKGELRVEADLGWQEGVGRLMLFSTAADSRPIAVMIPAGVARDLYFSKGQTYLAELRVAEGGLIYARAIEKN